MFKAKDIMKRAVIVTTPTTPIYDATRLLANRNITALPVVDEDLNLLAMLAENDALETIYDNNESDEHVVGDYMTTDVKGFAPNANLIDLCDHMLQSNCRLAPITNDGKLEGIISRSDLIRAILRLKHQELPN